MGFIDRIIPTYELFDIDSDDSLVKKEGGASLIVTLVVLTGIGSIWMFYIGEG